MLTIRNEQLAAFETASWDQFARNQLAHVREYFPVDHRMLGGDEGTARFIEQGIERCRKAGIVVFGEACRYIDLMLSLGLDFAVDPQLPWAHRPLADKDVDALHGAALAYLDRVAGEDGQFYLRAVVRARTLTYEQASADSGDFGESFAANFAKMWPRKNRELRGGPIDPFLELAAKLAERDGVDRLVYAGLMFLLGSFFAGDPLYPWAAAIAAKKELSPEQKGRAMIEAAKDQLERTLEAMRSE